ncbi:MAG: S-methyl-5-thioribose-1-phosphate isomerase [Planctomycetota bacterium]
MTAPRRAPGPAALAWEGGPDGCLLLLDQRRLPAEEHVLAVADVATLCEAIRSLAVRGAPALGVAAGYGAVLAARGAEGDAGLAAGLATLRAARPTAVNLFTMLDRQAAVARSALAEGRPWPALAERLLDEARRIHDEDRALCAAIGRHGAALLEDGMRVLTHCNTGRLATGGIGTALGVVLTATADGKRLRVYADETRPLLQGARLTMYELAEAGVDGVLLGDSAAAGLILSGGVDVVLVGADRIARNGDTANKVGTLALALAAGRAGVPFYVAAPTTSFDPALATGAGIPIEERSPDEVLDPLRPGLVPPGTEAWNPAFDVTPGDLVTGFVTERGVFRDPGAAGIKAPAGPRR